MPAGLVTIIERLASYAEVSPSGTGLRIFLKGDAADKAADARETSSFMTSGRYFTVTGQYLAGTPTTIEVAAGRAQRPASPKSLGRRRCRPRNARRLRRGASVTKPSFVAPERPRTARSSHSCGLAIRAAMPRTARPTPRSVSSWPTGAHVTLPSSTGSFASPASIAAKWDERRGADGATYGEITMKRALAWVASRTAAPRTGTTPVYHVRRRGPRAGSQPGSTNLGPRAKADPGVPFSPKVLGALALLKRRDPPIWARTRAALKQAGVSMRDLSDALKPYRCAPHPAPGPAGRGARAAAGGGRPARRARASLIMPAGYVLTPTATLYTPQSASADAPMRPPASDSWPVRRCSSRAASLIATSRWRPCGAPGGGPMVGITASSIAASRLISTPGVKLAVDGSAGSE